MEIIIFRAKGGNMDSSKEKVENMVSYKEKGGNMVFQMITN